MSDLNLFIYIAKVVCIYLDALINIKYVYLVGILEISFIFILKVFGELKYF